jgi:acyl phosphate:glycerol-3-phosphate acyltransferase
MTLASLGLLVFAYLMGSIPFSGLIARWRTGKDLYEEGEGNVGARNVWHVVGPKWGVLAGALDALKGFLVYLVSVLVFHASLWGIVLSGFAVALGHQFPLYARGRGGKGLSTMAGFLAGVAPIPTAIGLGTLGLVYALTREPELSALYGSLAIILCCLLSRQPAAIIQSLGFGVEAGLKKLLDRNHEEQVQSLRPWHEANPATPRAVFPSEENNEEASS